MRIPGVRSCVAVVLSLAAVVLMLADTELCRADVIYFKDGFILHGRIGQQGETITDKLTKEQFWAPKGFFVIDDHARRIFFSRQQVQDVDHRFLNEGADVITLQHPIRRQFGFGMSPIVKIDGITPWEVKGEGSAEAYFERDFSHQTDKGPLRIRQRLLALTPYFMSTYAVKYYWNSYYLLSELDPETVRPLLLKHPGLVDKTGKLNAVNRFRIYRFLVQANWYDAADRELDQIAQDLPDQKEKVDLAREGLQRLRAQQLLTEIERAHKAGRHRWAQDQVAGFPRQKAEERWLIRLRALQTQYETANENLTLARRFLKDLPALQTGADTDPLFAQAATTILGELNLDNVQRLEAFISLARLAERDREAKRKPLQTPAQLLALAITGWLQGNGSAETSVDMAVRLWRARQLVLDYSRTPADLERQKLLETYQREKGLAFDEFAQMIALLPPPEPEAKISAGPMELKTNVPGSKSREITYTVQVPPDYHHGRSYPVLIVLHHAGEKPSDMLERFRDHAMKNGYILAAPEWEQGSGAFYRYSAEEHATVLDTLRDLRRRFQVDSDRVFLAGLGEGGSMAYDVGLAHPDLFAGVLPMSARPRFYAALPYWPNAQYLPFYIVTGDLGYLITKLTPNPNRRLIDQWLPRGYNVLYIEYKGRGLEFFRGEVPYMFDWMSHKKRARAVPELGRNPNTRAFSEEMQTMRPTDNRFYWLSTESINEANLNDVYRWKPMTIPAVMQARIHEANQIHVHTRGLKNLTVWLGPDMMIDFDKPVTIRVNNLAPWTNGNKPLRPSLRTLLEDVYQRGDRQRLFLVEIPFNRL